MSMFWTIYSFVMLFERQRPINGYGTVAFFAATGPLQLFSKLHGGLERTFCYGVECDSTSNGGQCYHRLTP